MSAYLIVNFDIDDPATYKQYQPGAVSSLGIGSTSKVVAFDPDTKKVEGTDVGRQTVVLEFASVEAATEAYESEAYQAVLPLRFQSTSKHFGIIVKGL